jgi:DNA-directed RNA polymerase subunit RPC12/RpoP
MVRTIHKLKLKPCPLCGTEPEDKLHGIKCPKCGLFLKTSSMRYWNKRVAAYTAEELEDMLKEQEAKNDRKNRMS